MNRFYSLSFVLVLTVLLVGCGSNNPAKQVRTNDRSGEQQSQTSVSKEKTEAARADAGTTDLKQRTGIPFRVIQSNRDTLPLLVIMTNLERNMVALQAGIWRGNYEVIEKAATALANHAKIPQREVKKIRSILGKKGLKNFVAADRYWHKKAKELAEKADEERMDQVVTLTTELLQRCANCHMKYREPLRDSPKWRGR